MKVYYIEMTHLSESFSINNGVSVNGYFLQDGEKIRVTNIVGYDYTAKDFLKQCPQCGSVETIEAFDYAGRVTDELRDQSNCMDCRGNY